MPVPATAIRSVAEVSSGRVSHGRRSLLAPVSLRLEPGTVHLIVGPAGSGKSLLLRTLSGRRSTELEYGGNWRYRDEDVPREGWSTPASSIAWVPQLRNGPATALAPDVLDVVWRRVQTAFAQGADLILLDEPTRGLPQPMTDQLREKIAAATANGNVVVIVTHDLNFARSVAGFVHLLVYGELAHTCTTEHFFGDPPSQLARELVDRGCCAPPLPEPPALPSTFHWIIPGRLAGVGRPGLLRDIDDDLFSMAAAGIEIVVSTTEKALEPSLLRPYGLRGRHLPIKDMGVPPMGPTVTLVRDIVRSLDEGHPVAIHCKAGIGRTGTLLACVLVHAGKTSAQAISTLREVNHRYIQTPQQERFVEALEQYLRG